MQGLKNILEYGAQLQARVVQKYVENPFLINSCKFDIRQWVLVTSYEPLKVYFFNGCYIRLCQMSFNLDSLDSYRHLANYTVQKGIAKLQEETVWNLQKFIDYLKDYYSKDYYEILPEFSLKERKLSSSQLKERYSDSQLSSSKLKGLLNDPQISSGQLNEQLKNIGLLTYPL